jgi:hypothetical protein
MKRKFLLRTGLFSLLVAGSMYSFLYLNVIAESPNNAQVLQLGEEKIIEKIENIETNKSLPEVFLLEQFIKVAKNLIP